MKWAILGAGGCFGLNLARYITSLGGQVIGVGRSLMKPQCFSLEMFHQRPSWKYSNYTIGPDNEFIVNLLNKERPSVVVNFAAQGEGAASFKPVNHHKYFYRTNCEALVDLAARLYESDYLERFIHIGTSELYGSVTKPSKETDPIIPSSPYAASKVGFDLHLMAIHKALGFPMNIVRPSNCYTPGQQLHRIIPRTMLYAATGQKLKLDGGGKAEKSYLHATDLSKAILKVSDGPIGEVYNVGPDEPTSIREVVERCAKACKMPFEDLAEVGPERLGQDGRYWLDSTKVKALGWKQEIGWDEGLEDMRRWVALYKNELWGSEQDFRMRA